MHFTSVAELIAYVIVQEEEASALYLGAARQTTDRRSRELLEELGREELEHRDFFAGLGLDGHDQLKLPALQDLQISDSLVEIPFREEMTFGEVLIYAIKQEEKSCLLYRAMAAQVDGHLAELLGSIAEVERHHRICLEEHFARQIDNEL